MGWPVHTQNECCTIPVLFGVFGEVIFSLKAAISSSIYITSDNGASSAVELYLAIFPSFASAIFSSKL